MSLVKVIRSADARRSTRSIPKMSFSMIPARVPTAAAMRSIGSQGSSERLIPTSPISSLPSPRNWAMAGGSHGYRVGGGGFFEDGGRVAARSRQQDAGFNHQPREGSFIRSANV